VTEQYVGPLPHPRTLAEYEQVMPGTGERILKQWETESDHRRRLERDDRETQRESEERQVTYQGRGQWLGFGIAMGGLVVAGLGVLCGMQVAASIIGGVDLVAVITIFVKARAHVGANGGHADEPQKTGENADR
jgi:uncharacterized membrane protein